MAATSLTAGPAAAGPNQKLRAVPFTKVQINDAFWRPRLETNRTKTLPHNLAWCEKTGRISNFAKAGKRIEGKFKGIYFNDSDVYKVLEGAAYTLSLHPDKRLEARIDAVIDKIAAAQQPDGYLNSYYTLVEPDKRWTDLAVRHELYCAGHLFEAAVAYAQATGKKTLLEVACRFADHIDRLFGPDRRTGYPGHEEIELALIKLYRQTGEQRYRKLAEFFVEVRGRKRNKREGYMQAHLPVAEQREICGHAVRAMYLYSGVADVAALTGNQAYIDAMARLWRDVVFRKMYVTGGVGARHKGETFGEPFELPNDTAYAETCASIGMALWNHRLGLLHADGRFVDVLERVLYNGLLSGVALNGRRFFYVNPLASRGAHHRLPWYACACCPTNVVRFLPSIGGYVYAQDDEAVWVNLYIAGTAEVSIKSRQVKLTQETTYPWSGRVKITVDPASPAEFGVNVRIPGWCEGARIGVNGKALQHPTPENGYVRIRRTWNPRDVIEVDLPMAIRRIEANPQVKNNLGRVAIQRGPIVYCLEAVDNGGRVRHLALPRDAELQARFEPDLLGGVVVIRGRALASAPTDWTDRLYRPAAATKMVEITAIPYYAWDNREPGEMIVWIPESVGLAEPPPLPSKATGARASASHCHAADATSALNDGIIPAGSNDQSVPRFTWWDHKGTTEWVAYAFDKPITVSQAEVYWFDDTASGGGCGVPKSWRLLFKKGDAWRPVRAGGEYGLQPDRPNRVTFEPVETTALRLEVELKPGRSGGILDWRLP